MLGNRFLIYIKPAFLVLIVLIAPNMVPADYIKPLPDEVVSVESKKGYEDSEKAASDYRPIPAWLSSVLNWLPTENHENGTVAFNDEGLNKDIDENFTSPKKPESSVDAGNTVYLKDISPLYKSPKINGEGIWATTGTP
jgi:hypothetical protein